MVRRFWSMYERLFDGRRLPRYGAIAAMTASALTAIIVTGALVRGIGVLLAVAFGVAAFAVTLVVTVSRQLLQQMLRRNDPRWQARAAETARRREPSRD